MAHLIVLRETKSQKTEISLLFLLMESHNIKATNIPAADFKNRFIIGQIIVLQVQKDLKFFAQPALIPQPILQVMSL